ncbi:hypothetical protein [uncultured Winogradskyella sp.]|uniref:hypothetical protein n=1 Tax=uncultured Winogradskyella sp. TaxID=395353 RepID=UPI00262BB221|nr:hypothetical protein [uncultured Winogradskyella sp.]
MNKEITDLIEKLTKDKASNSKLTNIDDYKAGLKAMAKALTIHSVVVPKGTFACQEELKGKQKCDRQCSRIDCHYLNQEAS